VGAASSRDFWMAPAEALITLDRCLTAPTSFRRKPESRFFQRFLGPGFRRDDEIGVLCKGLTLWPTPERKGSNLSRFKTLIEQHIHESIAAKTALVPICCEVLPVMAETIAARLPETAASFFSATAEARPMPSISRPSS